MEKIGSFEVIDLGGEPNMEAVAAKEAREELGKQEQLWLGRLRGMPAEPLIKGFMGMSRLADTMQAETLKGSDQKLAA